MNKISKNCWKVTYKGKIFDFDTDDVNVSYTYCFNNVLEILFRFPNKILKIELL